MLDVPCRINVSGAKLSKNLWFLATSNENSLYPTYLR